MRKVAGKVFLPIVIFGIMSISYLTSSHLAIGQTSNQSTSEIDWLGAKYAQATAVEEQAEFSRLAQDLQTKITERDSYLTNLLQTINSNPPTEGAGGGSLTSECVIATAAFGSNLAPQVQFLRDFRDNQIKSTVAGSSFMEVFNLWYYSFSPSVAEYERDQPWLQQTVRVAISPLLSILQLSENGYSMLDGELGALVAGFIASSLIGMVYCGPIALVTLSKKPSILSRVILFSSIIASGGIALIATGIFLGSTDILMVATATFVLSIIAASGTFVAKLSHVFVRNQSDRTKLLKRRSSQSAHLVPAILILALLGLSASISAFAGSPVAAQQGLSKEEIEMQLNRLSEMKSWLEDTRRIESFFPDMVETEALTKRLADFFKGYNEEGSQLSDKIFLEGVQAASVDYQKFSSKIYNDGVAERHFTLKDTLSSAVLQLSYSTSDYIMSKTCECNAQESYELFSSSTLALETSNQNFYSYSQMLQSEDRELRSYLTEIESMSNGS